MVLNNLMWYPGSLVDGTVIVNEKWPHVAVACSEKEETPIYEYRGAYVWVVGHTHFIVAKGKEMAPETFDFFIRNATHCGKKDAQE